MNEKPNQNVTPDTGMIQKQLERILDSQEFQATERQREFLQFVVFETIAGRSDQIKGYTVATEVFGRDKDFDQATDPLVSIQANKLRRALERYYLVAGQNDAVHIDIPRGTYVPVFSTQRSVEADRSKDTDTLPKNDNKNLWPTLLLRPFKNLTGDRQLDYLAIGIHTELAIELGGYQDIVVLIDQIEDSSIPDLSGQPRFIVSGNIRKDEDLTKAAIRLVDITSGVQIWGKMFQTRRPPSNLVEFQEEIALTSAAQIASENGIIGRLISSESMKKPSSELRPNEAVQQVYDAERNGFWGENLTRVLDALHNATKLKPDCGPLWTILGRLHIHIYTYELSNIPDALELAIHYAEQGVYLAPNSQRSSIILAYIRYIANSLESAMEEAERAYTLKPDSYAHIEWIGYLFVMLGEGQRGADLIIRALNKNPYHSPLGHFGLFTYYFSQGKYEKAYQETLKFRIFADFWYPLVRAASLGHLGRYKEGQQAVKDLLTLKPDFVNRGKILIGHYVKFEGLKEKFYEGLEKVGLVLD